MKKALAALALAIAVLAPTADAQAAARPGRITVGYVPPKNKAYQAIYERLRAVRFLQRFQELLRPFELPKTVLIKLDSCNGEADAWYEDYVITICYEYVDEIWKVVPEQASDWGVAPIDTLVGPIFDTVLHEFGHALFEILKIPVFGREEDAADQVAAYMTLQLGKVEARRLIGGTANAYLAELKAATTPNTLKQYADVHGTPAQRLFNLLCIAYGADPKLFGDLTAKGYLPADRAENCDDEYRQAAFAFETLLAPHINTRLAKKLMNKSWLPEPTVKVHRRGGGARPAAATPEPATQPPPQ